MEGCSDPATGLAGGVHSYLSHLVLLPNNRKLNKRSSREHLPTLYPREVYLWLGSERSGVLGGWWLMAGGGERGEGFEGVGGKGLGWGEAR